MPLKASVETRLRLAFTLLTGSSPPGKKEPASAAQDVLSSYIAADLVLAAVMHQAGYPANSFEGMLSELTAAHPAGTLKSYFNYFIALGVVNAQLRYSGNLHQPERWQDAKAATTQALTTFLHEYLNVDASLYLPANPAEPRAGVSERRSHDRFTCEGTAEVRVPYAGPPAKGTLLDIGPQGCCIQTDFPFEPGRRVELMLHVNKLTFRAMGIVVSTVQSPNTAGRQHRCGIKFLALSSGGKQRLLELITELEQDRSQPHKPTDSPTIINVR